MTDRKQIERELVQELGPVPIKEYKLWDALLSREVALRNKQAECDYILNQMCEARDACLERAEAAESALTQERQERRDLKHIAEQSQFLLDETKQRLEAAETALRELQKWPVELAKVTGLGEDATPEETANLYADNLNQAIAWRDELDEVRELLRRYEEARQIAIRTIKRKSTSEQQAWALRAIEAVLSPAPAPAQEEEK